MLYCAEGCAGAARSPQPEAEMMVFSREWDHAVDGSPNQLDALRGRPRLRATRRSHTDARLRRDARGRDDDVREELAVAGCS